MVSRYTCLYVTHPADAVLQEAVEDVLTTQNRVSHNTAEKVFEETLALGNCRRVFLGLGLTLDSIVGDGLLGRNRRDDEHGVETGESLVEREERRVAATSGVALYQR